MAFQIKNILFPTNFSENARNALTYSLEVARRTGATLHVTHAIEQPYDFAPRIEDFMHNVTERVEELFNEMTAEIKENEKYREVVVKTHVQVGQTATSIYENIELYNIDFIVMGTIGRRGVDKYLFGSTTAEIIEHSEIPVMVVPQQAPFKDFDVIIFSTDYHDGDIEALKYVAEIARAFNSNLKIFHSTDESSLSSEIMFRGFRDLVLESIDFDQIEFEQVQSDTFFEAAEEQVNRYESSMLVMTRHRRLFPLFGKRHSKEMTYHTKVPLLMIPEKVRKAAAVF